MTDNMCIHWGICNNTSDVIIGHADDYNESIVHYFIYPDIHGYVYY